MTAEHPRPFPSTGPAHPAGTLVVDAANVVGARPDGWWKDRAGAARRLLDGVAAALGHAELRERRVVVVLEGRAVDVEGTWHGVEVVRAERDGDSTIVDVVAAVGADVLVVTSDRELRRRVEALGAGTRGASWLRDLLDDPPA
ncbi:NYN domain-containing protein [Cellulomonas sp.]|uniref:NYN domain-containing protein n=1 Tax=Cellulomonas sp. TaxID=40001 RepID=UPI0028127B83|nr:NYN domain-containing protein [Cellulomonas sp.]